MFIYNTVDHYGLFYIRIFVTIPTGGSNPPINTSLAALLSNLTDAESSKIILESRSGAK